MQNKGYLVISLISKNKISHRKRKEYICKFFTDRDTAKLGFVEKFNNSMGYKKVIDTSEPLGIIKRAEIESPNGYRAPFDVLIHSLVVSLEDNIICQFIIPIKEFNHTDKQFSYNTWSMALSFVKFLRKVFPDIVVSVDEKERVVRTLEMKVIDHMYICMDFDDSCYTVEMSGNRLLNGKELYRINKLLNECASYPCKVNQFYCETCAGHDKKYPYHIELEYLS